MGSNPRLSAKVYPLDSRTYQRLRSSRCNAVSQRLLPAPKIAAATSKSAPIFYREFRLFPRTRGTVRSSPRIILASIGASRSRGFSVSAISRTRRASVIDRSTEAPQSTLACHSPAGRTSNASRHGCRHG